MKTDSTPQVSFSHYGGKPPENYERYFVPTIGAAWATALLEVSGLSSGERVVDVAYGTGIVTRRASELVGPECFRGGIGRQSGYARCRRRPMHPRLTSSQGLLGRHRCDDHLKPQAPRSQLITWRVRPHEGVGLRL
jgi:hypothetical protein